MKPIFRVLADNKDITSTIKQRLVSLTIRDARGHQSDTLDIVLDDTDSKVKLPRKGAKLDVYLGFKHKGKEELHYKGKYTVDRISHRGPPDQLGIHAKAADMLQTLKTNKTRSWHKLTLGEIITTIASENELNPKIAPKYRDIYIAHLDQTEESDMHLLTRLAKQNDAIAKPVAGYLLFSPKGESKSAAGSNLPVITINRNEGDTHDYNQEGRSEYTGVVAYWQDQAKAKRTGEHVGKPEKEKTIKSTFATALEARNAAQAEFGRLNRDASTLTIEFALGKPEISAETTLLPTGYRDYIDIPWVVTEVTHTLGDRGLTTSTRMEQPNV